MDHFRHQEYCLFHDLLSWSYVYRCIYCVITAHNFTPAKHDELFSAMFSEPWQRQQQHLYNGHLSRTTQVSWYQKGKTNLDSTGARDSDSGIRWATCKSAPRPRQITTLTVQEGHPACKKLSIVIGHEIDKCKKNCSSYTLLSAACQIGRGVILWKLGRPSKIRPTVSSRQNIPAV